MVIAEKFNLKKSNNEKRKTKKNIFGDMPPCDNYPFRGQKDFRWEDSEITKYLSEKTETFQIVFGQMQRAGAIVFDPETKKWRGYRVPKKVPIFLTQTQRIKTHEKAQNHNNR